MLVRVRPGERIPVDGVVVEGSSHTDEAVITGESRQVPKRAGSAVIAGSINLDGPLLIQSSGAGVRDPLGADLPVGARRAVPPQPNAAHRRPRGRRVCACSFSSSAC